ncbi:MAG TPA: glycosyltransferase family 2 protein [Candidatus Nanoarchaeia archaeon]|nr:glycosyltransferase family 2 protein [Candidatus Nanoarchaeia archaeon]
MLPKVLVGGPTSHHFMYCVDEYIQALKSLSYDSYDILLVDNSKDDDYFNYIKDKVPAIKLSTYYENPRARVAESKNLIRKKVLKEKYDFFLNIDTDTIPPLDIIERFLSHDKQAITGVYYKIFDVTIKNSGITKKIIMPLLYDKVGDPPRIRQLSAQEVEQPKLIKVGACGSGCFMVSKDILEKIKFKHTEKAYDDVLMCDDIQELGHDIFCDTSVKCKHLILKKKKIE